MAFDFGKSSDCLSNTRWFRERCRISSAFYSSAWFLSAASSSRFAPLKSCQFNALFRSLNILMLTLSSLCILHGCTSGGDETTSHERELATEGDEPKIRILRHDYGPVLAGTQVDWVFPITNNTSLKWTPTRSTADCSCVVLNLPKKPINPGSTVNVTFSFRGSAEPGPVTRTATIFFDHDEAPVLKLVLTANIKSRFELSPESATINLETSDSATLTLTNYADAIDRLKASSRVPWIEANLEELDRKEIGAKQAWRLHLSADRTSAPEGIQYPRVDFSDQNGLLVGHAIIKSVNIAPVSVAPSQLFFGEVAIGEHRERSILVKFNRASPPQTAEGFKVSSIPKALSLKWEKISSESWKLTVLYTPRSQADRLEDVLQIRSSSGSEWTASIPVKAAITNPNTKVPTR